MAKLVFGMNMSLDGYVDHDAYNPDPMLFRHFIEQQRGLTGSIYGRKLYQIMQYWEVDDPAWSADYQEFAAAWRQQRIWVASRTLTSVGPNATLINGDVGEAVRRMKEELPGEIDVGGTVLANHLTALGLIDEYRIYLHPVVLGGGTPFFAAPCPPLRLLASERIGDNAIQLVYAPA